LAIENDPAERALCGMALGLKNYLFAGSDASGERAALIYSPIETVLSPRPTSPTSSPVSPAIRQSAIALLQDGGAATPPDTLRSADLPACRRSDQGPTC
jgi:hypothetical protein